MSPGLPEFAPSTGSHAVCTLRASLHKKLVSLFVKMLSGFWNLCMILRRLVLPALITALAGGLAACVSGQESPAPVMQPLAQTTDVNGDAATGSGACGLQVARLRRILAQDREMGHINESVYRRMAPGVEQAAAKCRAGDQNGALAILANLKRKNGYY